MNLASSIEVRAQAHKFLESHPVGTLSTISILDIPEVSTIYFFTDSDFTLYFLTKILTRKMRNLSIRPVGTIVSFDESELTSVEITGKVDVVHDTITRARIIDTFHRVITERKMHYWIPPIAQLEAGAYALCKLTPTMVHYRKFTLEKEPSSPPTQISFNPSTNTIHS